MFVLRTFYSSERDYFEPGYFLDGPKKYANF